MILVTGATGKFGGAAAQYLREEKIQFRAASKNFERLKKQFGANAEITSFDWEKPETFADALKGITTLFLMPPPVVSNDFHVPAKPFVQEAKKQGVTSVVLVTALYSDDPDSILYGTEKLVRSSGIDFTIIRPSFVYQNFLNQFLQSVRNGVIFAPSEKGKTSYVDLRNVGEAIAQVLKDPSAHKGKTYSITGSEALSHTQMGEIFSQQLSRPVVHVSPSVDEYKKALVSFNVPEFLHDFLAELYSTIARGQWEKISSDYTWLTGKKPIRFVEFVKEYRDVFSATNAML